MIGRIGRNPLEEIAAILSDQRKALGSGDVRALADLAPRLEKALARVLPTADRTRLASLRRLAAENAALLRAASDGVAAVRDLRKASSAPQLSTYTASGHLSRPVPGAGRTLSRR